MTLAYILIACLAGSTLSALLAALLAWRIQPRLIPVFVSYAVGALLGVVFLDLLPHIFEASPNHHVPAAWILGGILLFFVLEKFVLWRHSHDHTDGAECDSAGGLVVSKPAPIAPSGHAHGPSNAAAQDHSKHDGHSHHHHASESTAWMVIIGDGFHNFTDGLAIAAAFVTDYRLGVVTAIAIIAHEIPHELGDFLVLVHSGFSKMRALFWNLASSLATMLGAVLGYFALRGLEAYAAIFLCLAASSMIYVAIADLMPGLHKRTTARESLAQIALISLGVGTIGLISTLVH